jgi:outer membrane receptor for ferrienterochelin and colicins
MRRALWPATVVGLLSTIAHAEEPAKKEPDTVVVTGTRTPERSQRATVRTDVVTREEMDRRGATNVGEALSTQPGLQVNPGNYGFLGGVSAVQMQGFDRDRVLILEDGERVVGDVGGAIDLANLPTSDISRIEIVYGPSSSLYGSAALGGVINIITAPPATQGWSGRVRLEGRSYRGLLGQGSVAYRHEDKWAALDSNFFRMDGIERQADLPDLRLPESRRIMVGVRGGMSISPKMDVRVRLRAFDDRLQGLESQQLPGLPRFLIDTPNDTRRYTAHVIHMTNLGGGSTLRMTLGRQWTLNDTERDRRDSPLDERHDRTSTMQSFEPVLTLADGKARTWVAGARFEAQHFEQTLTNTESTSNGPVTRTAEEVTPSSLGSAALYGQLSWKFGEKVTVLPGVRTEFHTRYGSAVAPRLAASYRATSWLTARVSGGRGFRAPSAKELGFVFDHSALGYIVLGNRDLLPEKSWGVNGDVTVTLLSAVNVRAGGYYNWVDDLIDVDTANGVTSHGVLQYGYRNFGYARTAGGQLAVVFTPAPWLRAESSYDYTWTRTPGEHGEEPLPGRPPHSMTNSVKVKLPLALELYVRHRVVTRSFIDETTNAPGYHLLDARLARALWDKAECYVGSQNLLDVHADAGRVGDTRPPLGRILYVGFRSAFPWDDSR